jgi:hypothetical protein
MSVSLRESGLEPQEEWAGDVDQSNPLSTGAQLKEDCLMHHES